MATVLKIGKRFFDMEIRRGMAAFVQAIKSKRPKKHLDGEVRCGWSLRHYLVVAEWEDMMSVKRRCQQWLWSRPKQKNHIYLYLTTDCFLNASFGQLLLYYKCENCKKLFKSQQCFKKQILNAHTFRKLERFPKDI